jgi:threonine dehydratase
VAQAAKLLKHSYQSRRMPDDGTSRQQQQIVKLENVKTIVPILAARSTEAINFALTEQYVDEIVLVPKGRQQGSMGVDRAGN